MLIKKFQRRQEKARGREEWAQCNEGHWRCSFFKYYWEEGIKLPTTENCPECNGAYNNSNSSKRICFDDRTTTDGDHREFRNQWVSVHDRLGGKAIVHGRLGGRVNEKSNNRLEEMANSLVPDEDIMCRAPGHRHTLQLDEESSQSYKKPNPQWCLDGLTKSQKRRVQPLCQLEHQEEEERCVLDKKKVRSKVWRPNPKDDDGKDDKPQADINMVVLLPKEFMAPVDSNMSDEELRMAQLTLELLTVKFRQPSHEFTYGVGMNFISYPLVLTPLV
jgi:hypothetical protein